MAKRDTRVTLHSLDRKLDSSLSRLAGRLDGVDTRLVGVDKRLDGVDKRLDGVDKRLEAVDKRFDEVDRRFDRVDDRLDRLDAKVDVKTDEAKRHATVPFEATRQEIQQVAEGVASLDRKFDLLAERLPPVVEDVELLKAAFHGLDRRVIRLEDAP